MPPTYDIDDSSEDELNVSPTGSIDGDFDSMDNQPKIVQLLDLPDPEPDCPVDEEDRICEGKISLEIKQIEHLSGKLFSDPVEINNERWRVLCFPRGNNTNTSIAPSLSLFVDCMDATYVKEADWHRCVWFDLILRSTIPGKTHHRSTHHRYDKHSQDWGFSSYLPLSEVLDPSNGYVDPNNEDAITIEARVVICKGVSSIWAPPGPVDSKKETGFVGLKNQGATCYMNSMLQALYFTNELRRAVYALPTQHDDSSSSVPLALQRVFFNLQTSEEAVGTEQLTKSFGWNTLDAFMQHDVQEFNRVLMDNLETKMKGTVAEGTIGRLFQGSMKSYVTCMHVDYESSRTESYYDIQLNVKGMGDIYKSFDDYISVETLSGDNKYAAEGHGLQDARKGVIFQTFPPVLHLQLKRFEYDFETDAMVKVNDRFEFHDRLDLSKYLEMPEDTPAEYLLHAVLVHAGDVHGGHYVVFLRPTCEGQWYKFDDDRVTKASTKEALAENYGSEEPNKGYSAGFLPGQRLGLGGLRLTKHFTNAYMLVYVRVSEVDRILAPVRDEDIPSHIVSKFTREIEEQRRKEQEELDRHLYMHVHVATAKDLQAHRGMDLVRFKKIASPYRPLNPILRENEEVDDNPNPPKVYKIKREMPWGDFRAQLHADLGVPVTHQRFWGFVSRRNQTLRPDGPVVAAGSRPIDSVVHGARTNNEVRLLMEEVPDAEAEVGMNDILLFFKFYDPVKETLEYVGHATVNKMQKIRELYPMLRRLVGLGPTEPIVCYEEIKPDYIELCVPDKTLTGSEMGNGDIVVFQRRRTVHKEALEKAVAAMVSEPPKRPAWGNTTPAFSVAANVPTPRWGAGTPLADALRQNNRPTTPVLDGLTPLGTGSKPRPEPNPPSSAPPAESVSSSEDVVVVDEPLPEGHPETAPEYYAQLTNRVEVTVRQHSSDPKVFRVDKCTLNLSKKMNYVQAAEAIGKAVNQDPAYLRLYTHDDTLDQPKSHLRRLLENATLGEMLGGMYSTKSSKIKLYYEVLAHPLDELERKKLVEYVLRGQDGSEKQMGVLVPKGSRVVDLLAAVKDQAALPAEAHLRLLEITNGRVTHIFVPDDEVDRMDPLPSTWYRVDSVHPDILAVTPDSVNETLIEVMHFHKTPKSPHLHGSPFEFVLRKDEKFSETKKRLEGFAGAKPADFAKWKIALVVDGKADYLDSDDMVLYDLVEELIGQKAWVGLDHAAPRSVKTSNFEKAVVIHN
eukprot:comp23811_c0_seq1/m.41432 comp23811_c0_seq1/g.41432  ORF comp23811_c0_seq1/g.41432 comp23811_c0_seq1/m.41432 type:complete len:1238 (-) comp23811_c0_seq1:366-4079(-)